MEEGQGIFFVGVEGGEYIVSGLEEEQGRFFIKVIAKHTTTNHIQASYKLRHFYLFNLLKSLFLKAMLVSW